jgi:hypothetical protein
MSSETRALVRHTKLGRKPVAAGLTRLDAMCAAGAECPEVQASPMGVVALESLTTMVAATHAAFAAVLTAITVDRAASKAVQRAFGAAVASVLVYERTVIGVAGGDAAIIAASGLLPRGLYTPPAALGTVTALRGRPGKRAAQAKLSWPAVKGATGYAVEVSFTPEGLDGPWTALGNGSRRSRVVTAPAPGAQLLARVAAVAGDGTQSDWSPPILVTAR